MNIAAIALRNIFRNKRRSLLSLSAIAIVTAVTVFMFAVIEGMKADQENSVIRFTTGELRLRHAQYETYQYTYPEEFMIAEPRAVLGALERSGVTNEHALRLAFPAQLLNRWEKLFPGTPSEMLAFSENDKIGAAVIGVDFNDAGAFFSLAPYLAPGGRLPGPGEILIAQGFAARHGIKQNDTVYLFSRKESGALSVSGIVALPLEQLGEKAVYLPLASAREIFGLEGDAAQEILLRFPAGTDKSAHVARVRAALERAGLGSLEARPWNEIGSIGAYLEMASVALNVMAFFFFLIGTTVIVNTTIMVIYERMREIGTLRAMGMTGREMVRLFFMEAFFIGLGAALLGVILGGALVLPLGSSGIDFGKLADLGKMDIGISNVIYPQFNAGSSLLVLVYAVAVTSLISFLPTRRAAKIEPVEALRSI